MEQNIFDGILITEWRLRGYDVWGNAADGYEVNDVRSYGTVTLRLRIRVCNAGTPNEFRTAYPPDSKIQRVFGTSARIDTDGDDLHIYVTRSRDGYPLGEMECISHASLSPIRDKARPPARAEQEQEQPAERIA